MFEQAETTVARSIKHAGGQRETAMLSRIRINTWIIEIMPGLCT